MNPTASAWTSEANLFVFDRGFVGATAALFEGDLEVSRPLDPRALEERPLQQKAWDVLNRTLLRSLVGE